MGKNVWLRGQGGLHESFSEIDFLIVFDQYLSGAFIPMKNIVASQSYCCVVTLRARFLIACPE